MKKYVLQIVVFAFIFDIVSCTFLSCSKKAESHDADIGRKEDQLVVQELSIFGCK